MKKQIEFLNERYGGDVGHSKGRKAQGPWQKTDGVKRKNREKPRNGEAGRRESNKELKAERLKAY